MQTHWFYLNPETFVWTKSSKCLIYNSKEGRGKVFKVTNELGHIIKQFIDFKNLYSIPLSANQLSQNRIAKFINEIQNMYAGGLLPFKKEAPKPVFLVPILNLQSDIERYRNRSDLFIGKDLLSNLFKLHIYLNCYGVKNSFILSLKQLLLSLIGSGLNEIIISGNDSIQLPIIWSFIEELENISAFKTLRITLSDLLFNASLIKLFQSNMFLLTIIVPHGADKSTTIEGTFNKISESGVNHTWEFQVTCEHELFEIEELVNHLQIENREIKPVYTGKNLKFFKHFVYVNENDILNSGWSKREIFAHQAINNNDFGKLIILPNGNIHANKYHAQLGTLNDNIKEIVFKELDNGISWRRIRSTKPCCDCIYQWLCPSPSDYELAIGKPNLCNVQP